MKKFFRELLISVIVGFSMLCAKAQSETFTGKYGSYLVDYEAGLVMQLNSGEASIVSPKEMLNNEFFEPLQEVGEESAAVESSFHDVEVKLDYLQDYVDVWIDQNYNRVKAQSVLTRQQSPVRNAISMPYKFNGEAAAPRAAVSFDLGNLYDQILEIIYVNQVISEKLLIIETKISEIEDKIINTELTSDDIAEIREVLYVMIDEVNEIRTQLEYEIESVANLEQELIFLPENFPRMLFCGDEGEESGLYYSIVNNGGVLKLPDVVNIEGQEYPVSSVSGNIFSCAQSGYSLEGIQLVLPTGISRIQNSAFAIDGIISVTVPTSEVPSVTEDCFTADVYANATLHVSDNMVDAFKEHPVWSKFMDIVDESGPSLKAGDDFEYQGIIYTVVDAEAKTCKTKEGIWISDDNVQDGYYIISGNTYEGDLVIPNTVTDGIDDYLVTRIGSMSFTGNTGIISVALPEGLTEIESYAFWNCDGIRTVTLPVGLTTIGWSAFLDCSSLSNLTISEGLITIEGSAFSGCCSLPSLTLPESLQSMGESAFHGCSNLTSVNLPDGLTTIEGVAFSYCSSLTSLTLPAGLTTIKLAAFQHCSSLTTITLPAGVTNIGEFAFSGCSSLTSISLPNGIQSIGNEAFYGCDALVSVHYPASHPISASDNVFSEAAYDNATLNMPNAALADIQTTVPWNLFGHIVASDGESGPSLKAGDDFEYEGIIYTVIDPEAKTCKTKDGGWIENPDAPGESIEVPGNIYEGDLVIPATVTDGSDEYSVIALGYLGFSGNSNIVSVTLPEGLTTIESMVFRKCSALTTLTLPEGLISIGNDAFYGCSALTTLTLPEGLVSIGKYAFMNCIGLKTLTLPSSLQIIEDEAFNICHALVSVNYAASRPIEAHESVFINVAYEKATLTMPNAMLADILATVPWNIFDHIMAKDGNIGLSLNAGDDFEYEGIIYTVLDPSARTCGTKSGKSDPASPGNFFAGNTYEGDLVIPASVTDGIDEYIVVAIGDRGFYSNSGITSVNLPEGLTKIGFRAFESCGGMTSINLPGSLVEIGYRAFEQCIGLASINLPEGITTIESATFWNCSSMTSITFPKSLTSIAESAFVRCSGLTNLTFPEGLTSIGSNAFLECSGLISLTLPESMTTIADNAFVRCSSLTNLTLSEGLTSIGTNAFLECYGLISVTLPESLQNIGEFAFASSDALVSVNYGASQLIGAPDNVFSETAYQNATLNVPNATLAAVQATVPWSLFGRIVAEDGTHGIPLKAGDEFEYEGIIYTVIDPEAKTCKTKDGMDSASGNSYEGTLLIPETATDGIDDYTVTEIGVGGFQNNTGLTSVAMPESLQSIGEFAFAGCDAIVSVNYAAVQPITASDNVFSDAAYANATLDMPNATLADIQATTPWNLFGRIVAKDGSIGTSLSAGDDFEYQGIIYTVTDAEAKTCRTKDGVDGKYGNSAVLDLVIPQTASDGIDNYTVTGIGQYGFTGCRYLNSVTLPSTIDEIGAEAFAECPRLTSLVWQAERRLPAEVTDAIGNPNLLVYVVGEQYAPEGMSINVVVMNLASGTAECRRLVLETGYPFGAVRAFDALHSSMTKEFTQTTPIGGCAGWETIVLPFNATSVAVDDARGELTPFALITDITTQYPYWLYQAESGSVWREAAGIMAGIPYVIAMPNNEEYASRYRISGPVTFSNPGRTTITPETTAPYSLSWASGHEFRSLWLPLDAEEAANAMGLNVGIGNLTNDEGDVLAPGSAFHVDVEPRPLEAYATRQGIRRALPVMNGGAAHISMMEMDRGITVTVENGTIYVRSAADSHIDIFRVDGACFGSYDIKAGELLKVEGMARGVYIVAGHKVAI